MKPRPLRARGLVVLLFAFAADTVHSADVPADDDFFERRIRPVFAEHCLECHSAGTKTRGGLALDSRADLIKGGDSGPAVVPGRPEDSLLIAAVTHRKPDLAMPSKQPKLPNAILGDLTSWVRAGAAWPAVSSVSPGPARSGFDLAARKARMPWLWQTPRRQTVPTIPGGAQPAGDVDRFLRARLAEQGITPAPAADDRTWLRRVHFALTGLPPAPEAVRAFVDDVSPGRRERVVDGLLASPHFGERWARHWMDLVRYAESRGHESDFPIPNAWQYRDYLIRAFNADVPYDRFVSEHVAGDLVPPRLNPETGVNESVLATGWAFLGEEVHSPVDIRQDECERVDNKVDVLSKTFLGLTVSCARCHDHKFDPISQGDYYALSGFILGSHYRQVRFETAGEHAHIAAELEELRARHRPRIAAAVADSLHAGIPGLAARLLAPPQNAWTNQWNAAAAQPAHPLRLLAELRRESVAGELAPERCRERVAAARRNSFGGTLPADSRVVADFTGAVASPWKPDGPTFGFRPRQVGEVLLGSGLTNVITRVLPHGAACRDRFWNRLGVEPGNEAEAGALNATARAGRSLVTPTVTLTTGRLHYLVRGRTRVYAAVDSHIMLAGPLHGSLVATFDGGAEASWVTHDLTAYAGHRAHFEFAPEGDGELEILMVVESAEPPSFVPDVRWYPRAEPGSLRELAAIFEADCLEAARKLGDENLASDPRLAALADWLVRNPGVLVAGGAENAEAQARLRARFEAYQRELNALADRTRWTSRTAVAWLDGTGVDERVLARGKPSRPGETAPRALPAAFGLPAIAPAESSGRAELAHQLTDPANPLVARVLVNRVWQHVFGRGIVGTPDNFGWLGERPTHPELLDHLAWQFVHEDGWSVKRLLRRLVLTETFAMSSHAATGKAAELDPANTLLHRMPVRRLEAEAIRDTILAVSGRLDPRVGGPAIPVHLTEFIIGRGRPERSGPLDGDGRRSVYIAAPRNFLPTMMVAFDLPTPFSTVGRRNTTNVPGQPLTLMNDPFLHQQAGYWAARVLRTMPGAADEARVRWMFETAFARPPALPELQVCLESLADFRTLHLTSAGDGAGTSPFATSAELPVWTDLAHALFNANEFIYLN